MSLSCLNPMYLCFKVIVNFFSVICVQLCTKLARKMEWRCQVDYPTMQAVTIVGLLSQMQAELILKSPQRGNIYAVSEIQRGGGKLTARTKCLF